MNIRRKRPHDSLYMLLDTMCNAFGGIILLAVLVTLLTSKEVGSHGNVSSEGREFLEHHLAAARTNLTQSLALSASLQATTNDTRWKDQVALLAERQELRGALQQVRATNAQANAELDSSSAVGPEERLKDLDGQLAAARQRKLQAQDSLQAAVDDRRKAEQRLDILRGQIAAILRDTQQPLRLPHEHQIGKAPFYVILEYGRFYPTRNLDLSRNESTITWNILSDRQEARPIREKGIEARGQGGEMRSFLNSLPKDTMYVIFAVFDDSFPEFNRAKQMATACGLAYGWEPFSLKDAPVSFSYNGYKPGSQ